jgi:hemerythrin-like domain-containing protein
MADVTEYHLIHSAVRSGANRLAEAVETIDPADTERVGALAKFWAGYAGEVLEHHTVEDTIFFPALTERFEWARQLIERTDAEHHELDRLMSACAVTVARLSKGVATDREDVTGQFRALARFMDDHLTFEDVEILPVFEGQFDQADYDALSLRAKKNLSIKQALFTVPFIGHAVTAEELDQLLSNAPAALRVVWRLTQKRHGRLEATLFGETASRPLVAA